MMGKVVSLPGCADMDASGARDRHGRRCVEFYEALMTFRAGGSHDVGIPELLACWWGRKPDHGGSISVGGQSDVSGAACGDLQSLDRGTSKRRCMIIFVVLGCSGRRSVFKGV